MDRNCEQRRRTGRAAKVALRKESVDRNMKSIEKRDRAVYVALRRGSVDRNFDAVKIVIIVLRRSPQGECG